MGQCHSVEHCHQWIDLCRTGRLLGNGDCVAFGFNPRVTQLATMGKPYGTIEKLAAAEKINASYVSRVIQMTLLAPDIVEAVLNGKHSPNLTFATLMQPFSTDWVRQRALWGLLSWQTGNYILRDKCYRV